MQRLGERKPHDRHRSCVALALLAALAVLQLLVASGLPYGRFVWGGTHRVLPHGLRVASAASVLVYAGLAALLLSRAGVLRPETVQR